jgi:hypothetical protein
MMESRYWKTELLKSARTIEKKQRFERWSEKQHCLFEREIMLAMFCARCLIERDKITDAIVKKRFSIKAYPKNPVGPTTKTNRYALDVLFDFGRVALRSLTLIDLCNQIIHSYVIMPIRSGRSFAELFVCSEFQKDRFLYVVPIQLLTEQLYLLGSCYPKSVRMNFDTKMMDYKTEIS